MRKRGLGIVLYVLVILSIFVYADGGGGGGGAGDCFLSGTMITMADGSLQPVEDVKIGDRIQGQSRINTVTSLHHKVLGSQPVYSINGGREFVTGAHPFMTVQGWKAIDVVEARAWNPQLDITQLNVGDILITETGQIIVESIEAQDKSFHTPIYNFELDGDQTYYADSFLVHNKDCFTAGTMIEMEDGRFKPIEDVIVGERVKGVSGINTVESVYHKTLGYQPVYSINGGRHFVTGAHPFMTTQGWKAIDVVDAKGWNPQLEITQLNVGDIILTDNGQTLVEAIVPKDKSSRTPIFNFELDGDKTYYANGYLVHNKGGAGDGDGIGAPGPGSAGPAGGGSGGGTSTVSVSVASTAASSAVAGGTDYHVTADGDVGFSIDNGDSVTTDETVDVENGAVQGNYNVNGVVITGAEGGSKLNGAPATIDSGGQAPGSNPTNVAPPHATVPGQTPGVTIPGLNPGAGFNRTNANGETLFPVIQPGTQGPNSAFSATTFNTGSATIVTHDYIETVTAENFAASKISDVTLIIDGNRVIGGIMTAAEATTITVNDMTIDLSAGETLNFKIVDGKIWMSLDASSCLATNLALDLACAVIPPGCRYRYTGNDIEAFGLYNPVANGMNFELCIRTESGQDFTRSCSNCGLIDLITFNGYLYGIFELEKNNVFNLFSDVVDADVSYAQLLFDRNFERIEILHNSEVVDFNSGSINMYYHDAMYHYRFYDYSKPWTITRINPNITIVPEERIMSRWIPYEYYYNKLTMFDPVSPVNYRFFEI